MEAGPLPAGDGEEQFYARYSSLATGGMLQRRSTHDY